jgi:hypothetical protein
MGYEALADYYSTREVQPELPLGIGQTAIIGQLEIEFADAS